MENPSTDNGFVHLHVHSEFSFLDGASRLEALVRCARDLGQPALALTDHNHLGGAPEFAKLCVKYGLRPIFGAELSLDTGHVTVLARNREGFSSLCRLLTKAHLGSERAHPVLPEQELLENGKGLIVLSGCERSPAADTIRRRRIHETHLWLQRFHEAFGDAFYVEIQRTLEPQQEGLNRTLVQLAKDLNLPLVATNNVHYARPESAFAQDILTCIRHLITVEEPHAERKINGELYLKSAAQMHERFTDLPSALQNTLRIAERCELDEIAETRFLPRFQCIGGDAARALREITLAGARNRYGIMSPALNARLDYELRIIGELGFSEYFLVVHDLVQFARRNRIRHAGRGSAADSVVAYCLDITKVDAFSRNLRFERFINPERANNLPDIDIDFDSRRRDDVTAYVTSTYGRDHVATVCTFSRFRARSAIRDVAKALGFEEEDIDRLAKTTHWATSARGIRRAIENRPELRALNVPQRKFRLLFDLCEALDDLPRHVSTHLGGVVVTGDPIWEIAPLQMAAKGVQVIQYDKDGVEDLHLLKLDLLCLRMLGAVEDSVQFIASRDESFDLDRLPLDDETTFERIRSGQTAGAFQIESPAQMSLHPRLETETYEDVVASVALIRPGPVKGEMVEPFVQRRRGRQAIAPIHPVIDRILGHTYGVVLYQEQVISIAIELAGFSPGQADTLRRTISHHRAAERMQEIGQTFVEQAVTNGVNRELAERVFSWLQGYAGYGFCEAHAAAFGDTSYRTAYLLDHYPAEFYAAILNNQPMGFYPAATIVNSGSRCATELR
jgi:error-prone DNA polymerase